MFKTYSSSSSLVITSCWFATSRVVAPVSVRLVYSIPELELQLNSNFRIGIGIGIEIGGTENGIGIEKKLWNWNWKPELNFLQLLPQHLLVNQQFPNFSFNTGHNLPCDWLLMQQGCFKFLEHYPL